MIANLNPLTNSRAGTSGCQERWETSLTLPCSGPRDPRPKGANDAAVGRVDIGERPDFLEPGVGRGRRKRAEPLSTSNAPHDRSPNNRTRRSVKSLLGLMARPPLPAILGAVPLGAPRRVRLGLLGRFRVPKQEQPHAPPQSGQVQVIRGVSGCGPGCSRRTQCA